MKVSIQIPSFNQEHCIERAIRSALAQDYPDLEVIVCDDNSTDQTFERANLINDQRLRVYRNEQNLGRVKNYRHLLHDLVTGEWYVNLDGDDYFVDNGFISNAMEVLKSIPDSMIYQACTKAITPQTEYNFRHKLIQSGSQLILKGTDYFMAFNENEFFGHLSSVVNVRIAKNTGAYDYDSLFTDAESLLKVALFGNVILNNDIVGVWSIHSLNESNKVVTENFKTIQALYRLHSYSKEFVGEKNASLWLKKSLKRNSRSYYTLLANNDFRRFLSTFFQSRRDIGYKTRIFLRRLFDFLSGNLKRA